MFIRETDKDEIAYHLLMPKKPLGQIAHPLTLFRMGLFGAA